MSTSASAPDGTVIRPERPSDAAAIRHVVAAAFGSTVEADLVERIRASPEFVAEMALVAELAGAVVGHVMISGAMLRSAAASMSIVILAPLAVRPDHQSIGIGGALVRAALDAADDRGHPFVVLEGSPTYYRRFGFEPAANHGMILPLPDWAPPEAAQIRRLSTFDADDPRLRGRVIHPPAFDGLE